MAVLARRRLHHAERVDSVQRGRDLTVAAAAQIDWWRREASLAVTIAARDVGAFDMCAVPRTLAHGPPDRGNVIGDAR